MKIEFSPMSNFPNRDAGYYWHADVFDAKGIRYPVRLMVEGIALASFRHGNEDPLDDIVKALYSNELEFLLKADQLKSENTAGTLNTVFFAIGPGTKQIQSGDIVIYDTLEKLTAVAKRLGLHSQ